MINKRDITGENKSPFCLKFKLLKMAFKTLILCFKMIYLEKVNLSLKESTVSTFKVQQMNLLD